MKNNVNLNLKSLHIAQLFNLIKSCNEKGIKINLNIDNIIVVKDFETEIIKWKMEEKC